MNFHPGRLIVFALFTAAAAAPAAVAADTAAAAAESPPRKPNVIIIVGDDMGYGDIGLHGCQDIPTPHIDSIGKNGVRFTNGYVSGPYCSPTRAALLTGRYQTRFGHEFNPGPAAINRRLGLPTSEKTLADHFAAAGYRTAWIGKWHLGATDELVPEKRGFQETFGFLGGAHQYTPGAAGANDPIRRNGTAVEEPEYLTEAFGREGTAFIERHRDQPFFLYLAFNAVHAPLQAPEKYLSRFAAITDPRRQKYAAMMSAMDDAIGRVLETVRKAALEEKTLICFISDNGGPPGNGSQNGVLRGNKAQTWEGGIRVPFLMQWKGRIPPGRVFEQPVIQLDLAPTAFAACGLKPPADSRWEGVDLLPHVSGASSGPPHKALFWRFGPQTAVRAGDWKLVSAFRSAGRELFNLREDVSEKQNLAAQHPDKVAELSKLWDEWNATNIAPAWAEPRFRGARGRRPAPAPARAGRPSPRAAGDQ